MKTGTRLKLRKKVRVDQNEYISVTTENAGSFTTAFFSQSMMP